MKPSRWIYLLLVPILLSSGCQTLQQVANLRKLNFALDRVADAELAGIELSGIRSYEDLSASDVARLGVALADGDMPLTFDLFVAAENPEENNVSARMVQMDWTFLMEDNETISGNLEENFVISPGETQDFPVRIELDLVDFFDGNARNLFDLALAAAGSGEPQNVALEAQPTIETELGPIEYPNPITITSRDLGD